ncbi:MAG TPA: SDR family oxidoreductase [Luteitalea sp.]|nr:SDR family oxidoreductase [Luteitalea sp.]
MAGISGKVVVITGASSGIGEATAKELARRGARVVLGARRTDRLETLAASIQAEGGTALVQATDVTDIDAVRQLAQRALDAFGQIDVFINNAGVMPLSPLDQLKVDEWNTMIDVNIRGVLHGIAAALPHFKARKAGQFINVSSLGGRIAVATGAVYCGTKFAVHAISEALRQEVGGDIRVTIVAPGVVESDLAATITDPSTQKFMDDFRRISIPPEAIARAIAFAIEQPDDVDVSELIVRPTASSF